MKPVGNYILSLIKNHRKIFIAIGVLLILSFSAWYFLRQKEEKPQFQTATVKRGTIIASVSTSGQILSSHMMAVTTQASGIVKEVYVKDGDLVKKGSKILEITLDQESQQQNTQAYSSYLSAKNTLASAKTTQYTLQSEMLSKWDTFKELAESDTYKDPSSVNRSLPEFHIPEKDWLAAEAKYKNQEKVIDQAQVALNNAWLSYQLSSPVVYAPMTGTLTGLSVTAGMTVEDSTSTSDTSNLKALAVIKIEGLPLAIFNLSEIDVSRVEPGQKTTIILDSFPNKTYTGKVVGINKVGATTSGVTQYPAIIQFDTSAPEILPNMAATANIIIDKKDNALLVPSTAVQSQDGQNFVRVLEDEKVVSAPVKIGLISDTETQIISGLNEDDQVIISSISSDSQDETASPFSNRGFMRVGR